MRKVGLVLVCPSRRNVFTSGTSQCRHKRFPDTFFSDLLGPATLPFYMLNTVHRLLSITDTSFFGPSWGLIIDNDKVNIVNGAVAVSSSPIPDSLTRKRAGC